MIRVCKNRIVFLIAAVLMLAAGAWAAEPKPFGAGSLKAIQSAHAGKPFMLAFWSVYCEPCREEMALWKSMTRKYPGVPVILVATDPPAERALVMKFLARHDPGRAEIWMFADDYSERLRFAVDPKWRGELPRTYLFDAAHRPLARSGLFERTWIEDWLARQRAATRDR